MERERQYYGAALYFVQEQLRWHDPHLAMECAGGPREAPQADGFAKVRGIARDSLSFVDQTGGDRTVLDGGVLENEGWLGLSDLDV